MLLVSSERTRRGGGLTQSWLNMIETRGTLRLLAPVFAR